MVPIQMTNQEILARFFSYQHFSALHIHYYIYTRIL